MAQDGSASLHVLLLLLLLLLLLPLSLVQYCDLYVHHLVYTTDAGSGRHYTDMSDLLTATQLHSALGYLETDTHTDTDTHTHTHIYITEACTEWKHGTQ